MEIDILVNVVKELGYLGIFLWLWLGMLGIPIPNEIIVTAIGYLATTHILQFEIVFIAGYLGIVASLTTSYLLGRIVGKPLVRFFSKRKSTKESIRKGIHLIKKFHVYSLVISYFIPGVRNFVPFLYGMMRLPYLRFALLSYSTAFVWFSLFFTLGSVSGINGDISIYITVSAIVTISFGSFVVNWIKRKKKRVEQLHN
ncbi:DedA family protein [Bacillaceae bacterium IKA-2]|nr:DedA family protein [Bacillaceae bacterium IKA-2]